jgi:hypothetical protein
MFCLNRFQISIELKTQTSQLRCNNICPENAESLFDVFYAMKHKWPIKFATDMMPLARCHGKGNNHQTKTLLKGSKLVSTSAMKIKCFSHEAYFSCKELFCDEFFMMQLKPLSCHFNWCMNIYWCIEGKKDEISGLRFLLFCLKRSLMTNRRASLKTI